MELKLKKRIVGGLLLLAMGLIILPLFLGQSVPQDDLQMSGHIPNPPAKPDNLALPLAHKNTLTTTTTNANNSKIVFEQVQSLPEGAPQPAPQPAHNATAINSAKPAPPQAVAPTVATPPTALLTPTNPVKIKNNSSATPIAAAPANVKAPVESTKVAKPTMPAQAWAVQLGSFSDKTNAENLMKKLQAQGFTGYIHTSKSTHSSLIRVLVGPELRRSDADNLQAKIQQSLNIKGIVVKADI